MYGYIQLHNIWVWIHHVNPVEDFNPGLIWAMFSSPLGLKFTAGLFHQGSNLPYDLVDFKAEHGPEPSRPIQNHVELL